MSAVKQENEINDFYLAEYKKNNQINGELIKIIRDAKLLRLNSSKTTEIATFSLIFPTNYQKLLFSQFYLAQFKDFIKDTEKKEVTLKLEFDHNYLQQKIKIGNYWLIIKSDSNFIEFNDLKIKDKINKFISEPKERFLLITGGKEVGKSHLMEIINRRLEKDKLRPYFINSGPYSDNFYFRKNKYLFFNADFNELIKNHYHVLIDDFDHLIRDKIQIQKQFVEIFNENPHIKFILTTNSNFFHQKFNRSLLLFLNQQIPLENIINLTNLNKEQKLQVLTLKLKFYTGNDFSQDEIKKIFGNCHYSFEKLLKHLSEEHLVLQQKTEIKKTKINKMEANQYFKIVIDVICSYFHVSLSKLKKLTKVQKYAIPRNIAYVILYNQFGFKIPEMARVFKRTPSLISTTIHKCQELIEKNPKYRVQYEEIKKTINDKIKSLEL